MPTTEFHFPTAGMDVSGPVGRQPARPAYQDQYARTTYSGVNVRAMDFAGRFRGGSRPGLLKYNAATPGGITYVVQSLGVLSTTASSPVQPSQQGRAVYVWGAQAGVIYFLQAGGIAWITPTNTTGNTPPMNTTGLFYGTVVNNKAWFVDGTNAATYDPTTNTLSAWTASAGSFPVDTSSNKPRLLCAWRGRVVLSGLPKDPTGLFMTKVGDPTNFDYAPAVPVTPSAAWAGSTGSQGKPGDVVTALIPYTDDILIVGMNGGIAYFQGDPMAGGYYRLVNAAVDGGASVGIAWGKAWCMDARGTVYFFSSRGGVYRFVPGSQPELISQKIDPILQLINTGENAITMAWDDQRKELRVYVTLLATSTTATHYVWESVTHSWWPDTRSNSNHNPLCCVPMDGNLPGDRVVIEGGWDGYLRYMAGSATDDDGTPISSSVYIGPFLTQYNDDVMVKEVQAVLAANSADVSYAIYAANTAEQAITASPFTTGTWSAGRNFTSLIRKAANALYLVVSSTGQWAMENARIEIDALGKVRRRGKVT